MTNSPHTAGLARLEALLPPGQPVGLAAALVRIPTENPPGDEAPALEHLAALLGDWGWRVERVVSPQGRLNLAARLDFGRPGPWLALNGHLDVVPAGDPAAWSLPPYAGLVADGRLHGRGAADMKAGVAALVWGARLIQLAGTGVTDLAGGLLLLLASDEESGGGQGAACLVTPGPAQAAAAIIAEPTGLNLSIGARGALWARISLRGRAAHGSRPQAGASAIAALAPLITRLSAWRPPAEDALLGRGTLNLGRVWGGERINQVPASAGLEVDARFCPPDRPADLLAALAKLAEAALDGTGVTAFTEAFMTALPYALDPAEPWLALVAECAAMVSGRTARIRGGQGFTDARFYVERWGIPAAVLGPGSARQIHAPDEWVDLAQIRQAALIYALAGSRFLGPGPADGDRSA
ncbi:MAG: M20/M25/M40 family metallo-hydrolase [Pseudomonadota bacterium]